MDYVQIASGALSGIIVGMFLFIINFFNMRRQTIFEREKLDYQKIQKNKVLGEIINRSSTNKYIELSTLEYIIKIYNQVERELCFEINKEAEQFGLVTSYTSFFKAIRIVEADSGLFAIIDIEWIMETDKEIREKLTTLKSSIYSIYNGLYSRKYKKKIYKIIQVLEYVIDKQKQHIWHGNFDVLEFGIKKLTVQNKNNYLKSQESFILSGEALPYLLLLPRNMSDITLSSTVRVNEIIEGIKMEEGCNYYTFECSDKKPEFKEIPYVTLRGDKQNPVVVDPESIYIKEWHLLSIIHTYVNSYSEKILFKNLKFKNIYYRILNEINIEHKFK